MMTSRATQLEKNWPISRRSVSQGAAQKKKTAREKIKKKSGERKRETSSRRAFFMFSRSVFCAAP